jgi:hypothetical protein
MSSTCNGVVAAVMMLGSWVSSAANRVVTVPMELRGHFPVVTVNINGIDVPLTFGSGNAAAIALSQAALDRVKAVPSGQTSRTMDLKGNIFETRKFKTARLEIGGVVFTDVVANLEPWCLLA